MIEIKGVDPWKREEMVMTRLYYFKRIDIEDKLDDQVRMLFLGLLS